MPVTATNKVAKPALRAAAWRTSDPVWWRPDPAGAYVRFTAADAEALEKAFADHGRANLLPRAAL